MKSEVEVDEYEYNLCTFFLDGELRLSDRGQRQRFVGDEEHTVPADFGK